MWCKGSHVNMDTSYLHKKMTLGGKYDYTLDKTITKKLYNYCLVDSNYKINQKCHEN